MGTFEARDVYLTIVPTDYNVDNVLDTIVDSTEEAPVLKVANNVETPKAAIIPLFAPAATPAPAPSRLPVAVAGLMGGMFIGGVGVAALAALLLLGAGAVGAGIWWANSGVAAVEAAPVVEEFEAPALIEAPEAAPEVVEAPMRAPVAAPEAPKAPKVDAPKAEAPAAPVAAPAVPAAPVDAAPEAAPASSTVKLLSSPPAAVVLIDGVDVGRTPLKTELPVGTHAITIQSGKASGTFSLDTGSAARFCFAAEGRKVSQTACE